MGIVDSANRQTVDLPGANRLIVDDTASLRAAAGVSVFWDSPFGPVQFDFAQPLAYEEYDRREEVPLLDPDPFLISERKDAVCVS